MPTSPRPPHPTTRADATTILLTGFEPFGGDTLNPSLQVLEPLEGWQPRPGVVVRTQVLPCAFGQALRVLQDALDTHAPSVVVALGLAASRDAVTVERVAVNVDDARIPDNAGHQPVDTPVVRDGPAAYFATLPIKAIVAALRAQGLAAEVSQSAGTFVCNHVFYGLLHALRERPHARAGFVHLPCLPEQHEALRGRPGLPLQEQVRAVRLVVETILSRPVDLPLPGGAVD